MDATAPPPVGNLITSRETEDPACCVADVADRFFASPGLEALVLVEEERPVDLANRKKILFFLSRRFGFELFGRDPIREIADPAPLIVSADQPLDRVLELASTRHQETTRDILELDGFEVLTHDTPFRTTELVHKNRPDLVLLDVNMPGLSGERLCSLLRAGSGNRTMRVLFYSSNDEEALREAVKRHGADDYVCKGDIAGLRKQAVRLAAA